jgi:hypothetical protein
MYTTNKTSVPQENVALGATSAPPIMTEQTPSTIVGQARSATPRAMQHDPEKDSNIGPSYSLSQLSIETGRLVTEHHEGNDAVDVVDPPEQGETRAFLHEHQLQASPMDQAKARDNGPLIALLAAWWMESASLATAIAALIAIVVMLAQYNNKEQPTWKRAINLNTLVAILSTLMRACLVVVAEQGEILPFSSSSLNIPGWHLEVIGQLKWNFFRQPRPLHKIVYFDAALRGPWSSLLLVFRTRRMYEVLSGTKSAASADVLKEYSNFGMYNHCSFYRNWSIHTASRQSCILREAP